MKKTITVEQLMDILAELPLNTDVFVGNISRGRTYHFPLDTIKSEHNMTEGRDIIYLLADRNNGEEAFERFDSSEKEE